MCAVPCHPGFTIPEFAKHFGLPIGQVRRAVRYGDIKTVAFAGRERIPPAEAERVAEVFALKARDEGAVDDKED